jgi:hypothetical protein
MKKIILVFQLFTLISYGQTVGLIEKSAGSLDDGYVLFAPMNANKTYLIDKCGRQVKTWNTTYNPALSVYILPDGSLLHAGKANNTIFTAGGNGGKIEKIDWNGNVTWSYTISDNLKCQHHDVKMMPNGNVLVIAWELKTNTEAIAQGRNPAQVPATLWSEQVLEIQPVGATGGNIVWEWHAWDHLIQNYDNSKPNYNMNIGGNPQLINLNYNASTTDVDWIHFNSIDYNPALDQILLSSHGFSEVWVLDHSTTTAQAASHTGGNSGKGGDLLYRWGNPLAYSTGTVANRKFWGQHDARWIETGLPFANQIMVYNNGNGRTGGSYTTVEVINPPVSGFNYTSTTLPYLPTTQSWMYNSGNTYSYYAQNISGAQQLSNGNVLMTNGPAGTFTEVNTTGTTVWKYINPVKPTSIMTQGTTPSQNLVFKASFYPTNYSGFVGKTITTGTIIENSNTVSSTCSLVLDIDNNEINSTKLYPNPASETLNIEISAKFSFEKTQLKLVNNLGQIVFQTITNDSNFTLPVSNFSEGIYYLMISSDEVSEQHKVILVK